MAYWRTKMALVQAADKIIEKAERLPDENPAKEANLQLASDILEFIQEVETMVETVRPSKPFGLGTSMKEHLERTGYKCGDQ